jgi:hypothetical protein
VAANVRDIGTRILFVHTLIGVLPDTRTEWNFIIARYSGISCSDMFCCFGCINIVLTTTLELYFELHCPKKDLFLCVSKCLHTKALWYPVRSTNRQLLFCRYSLGTRDRSSSSHSSVCFSTHITYSCIFRSGGCQLTEPWGGDSLFNFRHPQPPLSVPVFSHTH